MLIIQIPVTLLFIMFFHIRFQIQGKNQDPDTGRLFTLQPPDVPDPKQHRDLNSLNRFLNHGHASVSVLEMEFPSLGGNAGN